MFSNLRKHKKILVTAPQRAGTRITAKIIANDTGHKYIDEAEIDIDNIRILKEILADDRSVVIQAPGLMRYVHKLDCFIVVVKRNIEDIIKSQEGIRWNCEKYELKKYGLEDGIISKVKYKYWETKQKSITKNFLEIERESLKDHPMYIKKKNRKNFNYDQCVC